MKDIFVIRETLTFFDSLWSHIDTIGNMKGTLIMKRLCVLFMKKKKKKN
jgi:hypothetical protein